MRTVAVSVRSVDSILLKSLGKFALVEDSLYCHCWTSSTIAVFALSTLLLQHLINLCRL